MICRLWKELCRRDSLLAHVGLFLLSGAVLGLVLNHYDPRTLSGEGVWIKPIKFSIAFSLLLWSVAWLLGDLGPQSRLTWWVSRGIVLCLVVEIPPLLLQAARGVPSHFNESTPLDRWLYLLMGIGAMGQSGLILILAIRFGGRLPRLDRAYLFAVRAGLTLFLLGLLPAVLMSGLGSHSTGESGVGGQMPLVHWQWRGNDLRIAHFIGIHAIQVLPIAGLLVVRTVRRPTHQCAAIWCCSIGYAALFATALLVALAGGAPELVR